MANPEVLVVLPTLGDRLVTLRETLQSVDAQRKDIDLTLVVVAPADATEARRLATTYGAVIVDDPREGISEAINRGIAVRTTETFYAWIGDDDLYRPHGLATVTDLLRQQPAAVVAFGGCDYIDSEGRAVATSNAGRLALFLLPWGPDLIPHPGAVIRLDALEAIGFFDRDLRFAMDLDAFLALRAHGTFVWTRQTVSAFRWHPDSLTVANRERSSAEAESVKRLHLPAALRPLSPLWHIPIRWASAAAARQLNARAKRLSVDTER
jgi:GT2 family glycosyltransferase